MKKNFTLKLLHLYAFLMLLLCTQIQLKAQTVATAYHSDPVVDINLMLPSGDSLLLVDGTAAMYDNKFSAAVDQYDANKLSNFFESICLLRDGQNLAIEARPLPKQNDTLFINLWGLRQPAYYLRITLQGIPTLLAPKARLVDNYLHTQTPVNFFGKTLYKFLPTTDSNSYKNRFRVVFDNLKQDAESITAGNIKIFPNPVRGNKINLQFSNMAAGNYNVIISSLSGEVLLKTTIVHSGADNTYYIPVNSVLVKGLNTVTIYGSNSNKLIHLPVILNN